MPPVVTAETHALTEPTGWKMLAAMATWPTALTPQPAAPTLSSSAITTIGHGLVHVEPNWLSPRLIRAMRLDAQDLFAKGLFAPDGLTNTALKQQQQGFNVADRQTFRNDAWDAAVGDQAARLEFAEQMRDLRAELARGLRRPTLAPEGVRKHEMTYNWYEPGAKLGRHLDEHHEETKGALGWLQPTRRSVHGRRLAGSRPSEALRGAHLGGHRARSINGGSRYSERPVPCLWPNVSASSAVAASWCIEYIRI